MADVFCEEMAREMRDIVDEFELVECSGRWVIVIQQHDTLAYRGTIALSAHSSALLRRAGMCTIVYRP